MYAPSSYNDTMTGETLSSVSEKSDSYSNDGSQHDYMVSPLVLSLPDKAPLNGLPAPPLCLGRGEQEGGRNLHGREPGYASAALSNGWHIAGAWP